MNTEAIEKVITGGDLSNLTPDQRLSYYKAVCESVGLNFLTQPLQYLRLKDGQGGSKLVLYATKACTDQLRSIHNVSVVAMEAGEVKDVYVVTARVSNGEGRQDMAKGAVAIGSLSGDQLANALMKAETKAKRRATLSICGLSVIDESEINVADAADEGCATNMHELDMQMHVENLARATNEEELKEEFSKAYRHAKNSRDDKAAEFFMHMKDIRKTQLAAAGVPIAENPDAEPAAEEPEDIKAIAAELQKKIEAKRQAAKAKDPQKVSEIEAPKVF